MRLFAPGYYKDFKCIGGSCEESCCIGWEIDIDPDTLKKYKSGACGRLSERLEPAIVIQEGVAQFALGADKRCPMLNREGLCDIITECGEDMLCDICREHPRFYNVYSDFAEVGVGIACPEAARLVLSSPISDTVLCAEELTDGCDPDYPKEQLRLLLSLRDMLFDVCRADVSVKALSELIHKHAAAGAVCSDSLLLGDLDTDCAEALRFAVSDAEYTVPALCELISKSVSALLEIEALDDDWHCIIRDVQDTLLTDFSCFLSYLDGEGGDYMRRLFCYFIYRYLLVAACDLRPFGRIMLSLCLALGILAIAYCGGGDRGAVVRAATKLSRNVEYSTDNVDMLIDIFDEMQE